MGRQIAICLTDNDVEMLERELRKGEDFRIIQGLSEKPGFAGAEGGLHRQRRMAFLVLSDDLPHVQFRPVPGGALYRVDSISSPVIEFSPCVWNGAEVRPGRLFFEPRYYEGTSHVEKSGRFLRWSNWIVSRCRKVLTFDRATNTLWGDEAMRLRDSSRLKLILQ